MLCRIPAATSAGVICDRPLDEPPLSWRRSGGIVSLRLLIYPLRVRPDLECILSFAIVLRLETLAS